MALQDAERFVRWIIEPANREQREKLQAMTSTEDRLNYAQSLGFTFSLAEHDQAFQEMVASSIDQPADGELSDDELANAAGGFLSNNPDRQANQAIQAVYASPSAMRNDKF